MPCGLTTLEDLCPNPFGGVYLSYAATMSDIEDITHAGNVVSNFTMAGAGAFAKYRYAQDDTAYYNQVGSRNGNLHEYAQESFFKFLSITAENQDFSYNIVECCNLVLVHFCRNGEVLLQGVEIDVANDVWRPVRNTVKPVNSIYTGTPAEESRVETIFQSISNWPSPIVDMDEAAMDALAGIV